MLDYYSSLPPPGVVSEKTEIKNSYKKKEPTIDLYVSPEDQSEILNEIFQCHLNDKGIIKYSYTGYYAGGVRREIEYYYKQRLNNEKKKKIKRKIKALFMTSYFIIKWYKESKEKMYHPDSLFVKEFLQSDFYNRI
tara:strand:- start:74 stop:481 length:408 start_codon:yes stop_codon:yes gene_type:complete